MNLFLLGVLLVFDITDQNSFKSLDHFYKFVQSKNKNMQVVVLGNKYDQKENRKISKESAIEYSKSINSEYFEVSALTGENIKESFIFLARKIVSNLKKFFVQITLNVKFYFSFFTNNKR